MSEVDQRRLRLYRFLLTMGRVTLEEVPEPYFSELEEEFGEEGE